MAMYGQNKMSGWIMVAVSQEQLTGGRSLEAVTLFLCSISSTLCTANRGEGGVPVALQKKLVATHLGCQKCRRQDLTREAFQSTYQHLSDFRKPASSFNPQTLGKLLHHASRWMKLDRHLRWTGFHPEFLSCGA